MQAARRRRDGLSLPARFRDETVSFLDWAESYVNQLDPLHEAPRTGEFENNSTYHFQNDLDRIKDALGRLLGADWTKAWKVTEDYTPKPRKGWYNGEPSVFEVRRPPSDDSADD